jgi:hypothetical protein
MADGFAEGVSRMSSKSISSEELAEMLAEYRRDYETRLQSRPNNSVQQARQVIQKARDLIRRSGIGDALTLLLEEVKYWPSWSQRDDLIKLVHFPATDIRAREESKEEPFNRTTTKTVSFMYGDKPYGLVFEDRGPSYLPDGEPIRNGTLDFIAEDAVVLSLNVSNDADGHEWHWFDLNALNIGAWTKDLLEIAAHINVATEDSRRHFNEKSDIDKAKKIRL